VALLSIEGVTRRFGGIVAVDDVSLDVGKGEIVGLIGPNGAGKTTVFNLITRLYKPESGEIEFAGESLLRMPSHSVVRRGIARTFQNVELFASMTVLEHVLMGRHARRRRHMRTASRASCPTGCRSASSSPVRSPRARACSSSTSRRAVSTTKRWSSSEA